jgi:hypothetical protein
MGNKIHFMDGLFGSTPVLIRDSSFLFTFNLERGTLRLATFHNENYNMPVSMLDDLYI